MPRNAGFVLTQERLMALNKARLLPETLHKPPALFHAVPGSQGPFTFQNHYTPNAATFCAQEQQKRKGIWTGSSLKTHNGASDRQRRGEGKGKILMNLASFQEDMLCPCISLPLHHFNVGVKHKAGAATLTAGLQRSSPAHSSRTLRDEAAMQSRQKRRRGLLDPKSKKWRVVECEVPRHSKPCWLTELSFD